ncbi:hypothetical protein BDN72DRAFT_175803 [Pluteus cervinus]|uniref:Uncharacterized protein n=1 Tax=Pluteus cervinus TaxID=181527 RepID=A0ACD3AKY1_9AGAR|nr:hypothetical protein BDN72DRAFT_175803 [Pluteus cervinus]
MTRRSRLIKCILTWSAASDTSKRAVSVCQVVPGSVLAPRRVCCPRGLLPRASVHLELDPNCFEFVICCGRVVTYMSQASSIKWDLTSILLNTDLLLVLLCWRLPTRICLLRRASGLQHSVIIFRIIGVCHKADLKAIEPFGLHKMMLQRRFSIALLLSAIITHCTVDAYSFPN